MVVSHNSAKCLYVAVVDALVASSSAIFACATTSFRIGAGCLLFLTAISLVTRVPCLNDDCRHKPYCGYRDHIPTKHGVAPIIRNTQALIEESRRRW